MTSSCVWLRLSAITAIDKLGLEANDKYMYRDSCQTDVVFIDQMSTLLREAINIEGAMISPLMSQKWNW